MSVLKAIGKRSIYLFCQSNWLLPKSNRLKAGFTPLELLNSVSLHFTALTSAILTPQGIPLPFFHTSKPSHTLSRVLRSKKLSLFFFLQRHFLTYTWHSVKIYERLQRTCDLSQAHLYESESKMSICLSQRESIVLFFTMTLINLIGHTIMFDLLNQKFKREGGKKYVKNKYFITVPAMSSDSLYKNIIISIISCSNKKPVL